MTGPSPQIVFLTHESWLRTVVRSRLNESEAVEDVMQNIALAIVRQRHDLDRQVLMLKYSEGWSYREMAKHLGVREDTIEYRLLKARKNLRRLLRPLDEEGE